MGDADLGSRISLLFTWGRELEFGQLEKEIIYVLCTNTEMGKMEFMW